MVPESANPSPYPDSLPAPTEPIIGRGAEVDRGLGLVEEGCRLVTITGPAGVGKTRLAVEIAERLADSFGRAVIYVELAALADADLVHAAIAAAAGFDVAGEQLASDAVAAGIGERPTLLVLDNAEHLVAAIADVARLLDRCPELCLVVTSQWRRAAWRGRRGRRAALGPGRTGRNRRRPGRRRVGAAARPPCPAVRPGLHHRPRRGDRDRRDLPPPRRTSAGDRAGGGPAAGPCPGRARSAARSQPRCAAVEPADAPHHQRTLRAAIDWSYQLLEPDDRRVLRALSVFAGGFTFDAVAAVTGADRFDVLDQLERLVAHHLVRVGGDDPTAKRFDVFESIREFGAAELVEAGEDVAIHDADAAWASDFVATAAVMLTGAEQGEGMLRLSRELDNLRAALTWLSDIRQDDAGLRLATPLWRYWWMRGAMAEGRRWLDRMIDRIVVPRRWRSGWHCTPTPTSPRSRATRPPRSACSCERPRSWNGSVTTLLSPTCGTASASPPGRCPTSVAPRRCTRRPTTRSANTTRRSARSDGRVNALGHLAYIRGDAALAAERWQECADTQRARGDQRSVGAMLGNVASALLRLGDLPGAIERNEESPLARGVGDVVGTMSAMTNLGGAYVSVGDIERGTSLLEESLAIGREAGANYQMAVCLHSLHRRARAGGDLRRAAERLLESLALFDDIGFTPGFADCLLSLGSVAVEAGRHADAVSLFVAGAALHERHGSTFEDEADAVEADIATAEAALGADELAARRANALSWTRHEAVVAATELVPTLPGPTPAGRRCRPRGMQAGGAHGTRVRDREPPGASPHRPGDRPTAVHQYSDRDHPRLGSVAKARRVLAARGRGRGGATSD